MAYFGPGIDRIHAPLGGHPDPEYCFPWWVSAAGFDPVIFVGKCSGHARCRAAFDRDTLKCGEIVSYSNTTRGLNLPAKARKAQFTRICCEYYDARLARPLTAFSFGRRFAGSNSAARQLFGPRLVRSKKNAGQRACVLVTGKVSLADQVSPAPSFFSLEITDAASRITITVVITTMRSIVNNNQFSES